MGVEGPMQSSLPEGRLALLFTDIQGSTTLLHELGDTFGELLDAHDGLMRGVFAEYGGIEVDNEGDAFFVVFEDHRAAVAATSEVVRRCAAGSWPGGAALRVRMALHSGEPRVRGRRYWGVDVHYAARLCSASHGGQVLLSASMRDQLPELQMESLGEHGLKDFATPRELYHLVVDGSASRDFPPPRTLSTVHSNVPSVLTPIVGREEVLSTIRGWLTDDGHRLVTLVGAGGIGKTRTAIACAEAFSSAFAGGAAFAALAAVENETAALVAAAVAVGQPPGHASDPGAALRGELAARELLLVLDNAEHLPGLGAELASLLVAAPGLRILATSQAPLGVRGERVMRLDALEVPPIPTPPLQELVQVASVAMLLDRVRAKETSYEPGPSDGESIAELCRLLEGMPLALELAAARLPVAGVAGLLRGLRRDPDALGGGPADLPDRQRSLRAALDWTVGLLSPEDRDHFVAFGAFGTAWSLEEAEFLLADVADPSEVWSSLTRLLDLSLVVVRGDGRFTTAERVRRHAQELLRDSGNERAWRRRHAVVMAEQMDARRIESVAAVLGRSTSIDNSFEETIHAIGWAAAEDPATLRLLVAFSAVPFTLLGRLSAIADSVMELTDDLEPRDRVDGLLMIARASVLGRGAAYPPERRVAALAAVACLEIEGNTEDRLLATCWATDQLAGERDLAAAEDLLDRLEASFASQAKRQYAPILAQQRVHVASTAGHFARAELLLDRFEETGTADPTFILNYRADNALGLGEWRRAAEYYARGLAQGSMTHFILQIWLVQGVACALAGLGRHGAALELIAGIERVHLERQGTPHEMFSAGVAVVDAARARASDEVRQEAERRGRALSYDALCERAVELAAEVTGADIPAPHT